MMRHIRFVIASGATQSPAIDLSCLPLEIAASPSASRNDDVIYIADQESY